ncbi:hypothetical protein ACET3Z_013921 [Daucus carota]
MDSAGITNNDSVSAGDVNQRERFSVELTPGQTNIVSLKKLRREAGEVVSDDSLEEENEAFSSFLSLVVCTWSIFVCIYIYTRKRDKYASSTAKTPLTDVQGPDASLLDKEIQLSPELKQNLAEVARSTQLIEGEISEELITRLMGILGNYIKRKTLKKILKEMILEDIYARKAKCSDFKQTKKDLVEMIRHQAPSSNLKLAELWPKDTMDPNQIREAIWQARGRRMVLDNKEGNCCH